MFKRSRRQIDDDEDFQIPALPCEQTEDADDDAADAIKYLMSVRWADFEKSHVAVEKPHRDLASFPWSSRKRKESDLLTRFSCWYSFSGSPYRGGNSRMPAGLASHACIS